MEPKNEPTRSGEKKIVFCNVGIQIGSEKMKTSRELAEVLRHTANMIENDGVVEWCGTLSEQIGANEDGGILKRPISDADGHEVGLLSFIEE